MFSGASDDVKPIVGGFDVHPLSNRKTRRENIKNNRNRERTAPYTVGWQTGTCRHREKIEV